MAKMEVWITVPLAVFFMIIIIFSTAALLQTTTQKIYKDVEDQRISYEYFPTNKLPDLDITTHLTLVAIFGGLAGSAIHGLSSLAFHVKKDDLDVKFTLWYITRPFMGVILSLVVYFGVLGGILTNLEFDQLNPYGVATIGVATGLTADRVILKLGKLVDVLFGLEKKDQAVP